MTTAKRNKTIPFRGALSLSVALALLALVPPIPVELRVLIVFAVTVGWFWAACRWSVRRFGRKSLGAIAAIGLTLSGLAGYAYWRDAPNRRTLAQIEQLPGCSAATEGQLLTGKVYQVYISSEAGDQDVLRFTELEGLDQLRNLILDGSQISDATARRIGRLKSLWNLSLLDTGISEAAVEELLRELPNCNIEVR
jgi:hypothetical protein